VAPPVPHDVFDSPAYASHVPLAPPLQQPFGHDVASHTHVPFDLLHLLPLPHGPHVAPPAPQVESFSPVSATHAVPLQQPAHVEPPQLQLPLLHACPAPHALHRAPPVPQEPLDCAE
jgi:hypothetical protein